MPDPSKEARLPRLCTGALSTKERPSFPADNRYSLSAPGVNVSRCWRLCLTVSEILNGGWV